MATTCYHVADPTGMGGSRLRRFAPYGKLEPVEGKSGTSPGMSWPPEVWRLASRFRLLASHDWDCQARCRALAELDLHLLLLEANCRVDIC